MPRTTPPRGPRHERGQVLAITAILLAVIGGFAALAIDLGSYSADRRDLQNAADAIALAASQELPNGDSAHGAANSWAIKNDISPSDMTVTVTQQNWQGTPNPMVKVTIARPHDFTFARLIGIQSTDVSATATSIKTSPAGGDGVIPLSVTEERLASATYGSEVVLKYDANNIEQGNTSPIRIDGPGSGNCGDSDRYCSGLEYGSENAVCAAGADDTYCSGVSVVDTEPGNKVGATRTAMNYRLDITDSNCNSFGEVFEDDPTTNEAGVYSIVQGCNPFLASGYSSGRVLIIPVIDSLCNGSCSVTITNFALFYLERIGDGGCTGNECEVVGRFVRVSQNVGLLAGTYNANASIQFVRLVQ